MGTTYRELAESMFDKIRDSMFVNMDEQSAYDIAMSYIPPSCMKFRGCTQDLSDRDDNTLTFNFDLTPDNFQILVNYMCIEYIDSNYLRVGSMLKARLTSTDFHSLNLYNQLSEVKDLRNTFKAEIDQIAFSNSYSDNRIYEAALGKKV